MSTTLSVSRAFYGWRVVAAAFVVAIFGWGIGFYGPPVFLYAVREARGWSIAVVSIAVTVHFLIGAVLVANLPGLYRRFGIPRVTKAGAVILALGICGWASAEAPWQLLVATLLSGTGWVMLGAAAINTMVSPWFVRARPAALATAYNGASVGGILLSPLWVAAIDRLGFPLAALLIGLLMTVTIWVLADCIFAKKPEQMGVKPDGDTDGAAGIAITSPLARPLPGSLLWHNRRFLTLAAGMALSLFVQVGLVTHLFSVMVPTLGVQGAGLAMGLATACAIAGRTLVGWLMPASADRRVVAIVSYAVQIAGSIAFVLAAGQSIALLLVGVILFGAGIGNATSLPPLIAQVEFVKDDVSRVVSLIVATGQATYSFAPAIFGAIREWSAASWHLAPGDEALLFVAAAAVQFAAILCLWSGRK